MDKQAYYNQTPIMRRILEYSDGAVMVVGTNPDHINDRYYRKYNDIIHAMGEGCDLYRSILDLDGVILALDLEYGNRDYHGEVFHHPLETFEKLESTRAAIRDLLDEHAIKHIELMTGQGYNFVMRIARGSPTYKSLLTIGHHLKVLSRTTLNQLEEKEREHGNMPLVDDNLVFAAFGRVTDYVVDQVRGPSALPLHTSDIYDDAEIAILDTTLYGYLITRRMIRCAFSLHQKTLTDPIYGFDGPPIVAIPSQGVSLEERLKIRQDERGNYAKACAFARETSAEIPVSNLGSLLVNYTTSDVFSRHSAFAKALTEAGDGGPGQEDYVWHLSNWDVLESKLKHVELDAEAYEIIGNPNPKLLEPWWLRHIIRSLRENDFNFCDVVSLITSKYLADFGWGPDLHKNDAALRAEYWARTLWDA